MKNLLAAFLMVPSVGLAAGGGGIAPISPPTPTETTKTCKGVQIWDAKKKACVNPKGSSLGADTLYLAVRELAYAGRFSDAQAVLAAMPDQNDDRVLTYWGFTYRKMGQRALGRSYYEKAIARNPDNILARSYMGQGLVDDGDIAAARAQLHEIRARGGRGTWPEVSLSDAIRTGRTYDY